VLVDCVVEVVIVKMMMRESWEVLHGLYIVSSPLQKSDDEFQIRNTPCRALLGEESQSSFQATHQAIP
jgi:hypothetical protein